VNLVEQNLVELDQIHLVGHEEATFIEIIDMAFVKHYNVISISVMLNQTKYEANLSRN
jgi:hypothetical protein